MTTILWIIAVILVIVGIVQIVQGQLGLGIVLIIVGLLVGPGGVSIFATSSLMGARGVSSPGGPDLVGGQQCFLRGRETAHRRDGDRPGGSSNFT